MDSFAQQMFNEIERRYKAYHFSSSSISLNEECDTTENENCLKLQQQSTFPSIVSIRNWTSEIIIMNFSFQFFF